MGPCKGANHDLHHQVEGAERLFFDFAPHLGWFSGVWGVPRASVGKDLQGARSKEGAMQMCWRPSGSASNVNGIQSEALKAIQSLVTIRHAENVRAGKTSSGAASVAGVVVVRGTWHVRSDEQA